ncbi:AChain A, Cyclin-G-associated kinase [Histomonas meleagridis]|uniref:AChain A, Cyclin-G-associated kinase n=1 Tax=Histomonas meleagridis TaxID=135588 RepID=UPI003559B7B1|nr:AChain A, Cyclin-G-associated kinase [Histomonas meleagridis]KAH0805311.1 AChain A, Cyclin-G-associated kinase [Histomonas meleagridis]
MMSTSFNSLIGKTLKIENYSVTVKKKLSENNFNFVFQVEDNQGKPYSLKIVNCVNQQRYEQNCQRANSIRKVPPHSHIIKLYAVDMNPKSYSITLLYEYCPLTASEIINKRKLTRDETLIFFIAISSACAFLHSQSPPIIHRDLRAENILIAEDGTPKICDFGSITSKIYYCKTPEETQIAREDIELNTALNYRSPEMINLIGGVEIGPALDVWVLGCTLYKLIFREDMFKLSEKAQILQGKFKLPSEIEDSFATIISKCVQVNPSQRPTAAEVAGTALMMHGVKKKIDVHPQSKSDTVKAPQKSPKETARKTWTNPIKYFQEQYRSFVSTGVSQWAIKATFASNDPPDSKFVRRVVLASIRHTEMTPISLVNFLYTQRPWKEDPRVAAKSLYLILLLVQYEQSLDIFIPITVKTDKVISHFSGKSDSNHPMVETIKQLGIILRTKVMMHSAHKGLEGNLAIGNNQVSENLEPDLDRYLDTIASSAMKLINTAKEAKDFCIAVISRPAVEEVSNSVKLLSFIKKSDKSKDSIEKGNSVLNEAKKLPYLQTSISFPDETKPPMPPPQRFNIRK